MSAFMVSKAHIDKMVALAAFGPSGEAVSPSNAWYGVTWWTDHNPARFHAEHGECDSIRRDVQRPDSGNVHADELGRILILENGRSLSARYRDPMEAAEIEAQAYTFPVTTRPPTALEGLQAIACYEYQACESIGWQDSDAAAFCEALRRALCSVLTRSVRKGWDNWEHVA